MTQEVCCELFEKTVVFPPGESVAADVVFNIGDHEFIVPGSLRSMSLLELVGGRVNDGFDVSEDENGGLTGLISKTLLACSADVRSEVSRNIVFCGGGASIPGMANVVCQDLQSKLSILPCLANVKVCYVPFEKSLLTYLGGSIYSSLRSNDEEFISSSTDAFKTNIPDWIVASRPRV